MKYLSYAALFAKEDELSTTPFTEREQRLEDDFDWAFSNNEMIRKHGGKVVMVRERAVHGVGRSFREARQDAMDRGFPNPEVLLPVTLPQFPAES